MDVGRAWFGNHFMFSCNKSTQVWSGRVKEHAYWTYYIGVH